LAPTPTNGVYGRNFPYAWLQLIPYNNSPQFRSNRRQKFFSKKPWTPTFYQICTRKKHLNGRSFLIKHNMTMNLYTAGFLFSMHFFWVEKNLPRFFRLREIHKKPKNSYFGTFLAPTPTNGVYGRNFPYAWLQLIPYNNSPQFRSNRRQKFFSKKPWTPTFYQICTRKKHLNGRSSLIKHNMTMNYTPMDSSFQCASFESKKNLPRFFRLSEIHKKPKKLIFWHIFGSHTNKWGLWPELSLCLTSTHPIQ
jgi:hypothetical protein